ncbi:MAG TPA: efflux RND transporter periplasmic adaptor subunit [Phycisphaerae bacterium]|nr:efflux RND transporter periplasmic adaptor subunit [Phycisphaerae bacterium]
MKRRTSAAYVLAAVLAALAAAAGVWKLGPAAERLWAQAPAEEHDHDADHGKAAAPAKGAMEDHAAPDHAAHGEEGDDHGNEKPAAPAKPAAPGVPGAQAEDAHAEHAAEGEGPDAHAGHDPAEEMGAVRLTPEQMRQFGIELATASPGRLQRAIRLPGEIAINGDTAAHIAPPAPGVVRKVTAKVGDRVRKGDVLAVLESAELSEAQTGYLAKLNEVSCCTIDLDRAQALHEGTGKLLALLDGSPTLEELRHTKFPGLGEGQGKLVAAYAELAFSEGQYEREKKLFEQQIASKGDFQTAENAYKKAFAEYVALRESVAFATRRTFLEAQRSRQNTELAAKAADRKLHVLGLTTGDVHELQEAFQGECADPNCPSCQAKAAAAKGPANEEHAHEEALEKQLGLYSLRAPFDGTVIQKHITLGERVSDEAEVYTVADLSTVWVDLSVYQKDLPHVRRGQPVHVAVGSGVPDAEEAVAMVSPIVDEITRTCLARVVLPNPDGAYRPGLFVTGEIVVEQVDVPVRVPADAVQRIEDRPVVFVPTPEGLEATAVRTGRSDPRFVEIVSGLAAGQKYVARGAFELKAKIVTSGLGAHAGHGH